MSAFAINMLTRSARTVSFRFISGKTKGGGGDTATLVLLRHGQSTWNATPTFTGWYDAPLTERGIAEAKASGVLLRDRKYDRFDVAFTSNLQRAVVTCELALENAGSLDTPVRKAWQLNERHYGALQGHLKDDPVLEATYGAERLRSWRRDLRATPPPMDELHPHYLPPPAPRTESLADCQDRVLEFYEGAMVPEFVPGSRILLAAHSNTLRALVARLDDVPIGRVPHIRIPNGVPFVYRIDPDSGRAVSRMVDSAAGGSRGRWMFSPENQERLRKNIGVSGDFIKSMFEGWDVNGDGVLSLREIEKGLRGLMGGDDVAVAALAGKVLEEVDAGGSRKLDLEEFEARALDALRRFMPGILEDAD